MKNDYSLEEYQADPNGACVALGFFDGVHVGHRAVIAAAAEGARQTAAPCVVLTFRESPAKALDRPVPLLLTANDRKKRLMEEAGADAVIFADFSALKELSPDDFVKNILRDRLGAKLVCCGFNYRFGRHGAGDTETLRRLCFAQGIAVRLIPPVVCDGETASSSRIRELIAAGDIARANQMLGCRYAIEGSVGSGNRIGSSMGFPTVNIPLPEGIAAPRFGVYASQIVIGGVRYRGATNIGVHPTVGANEVPLCETFLLDFDGGDLYGKNAVCELTAFIRPEKRFGSVGELTEQVRQDCQTILNMA